MARPALTVMPDWQSRKAAWKRFCVKPILSCRRTLRLRGLLPKLNGRKRKSTMNCPNCAEPLAERGVFCKACAAQAKCIKCREVLEPGALACVECGTRIGAPVEATDGTPTVQRRRLPRTRNTLSYQEDRNSRRFEASLTDSAMNGLGDVFGELFAQRGVGRTLSHSNGRNLPKMT